MHTSLARIVIIITFLLLKGFLSFSNPSNSCGVTASFTPDNDSLVSGPFNVLFQSTSTNATSLMWHVNGTWSSTNKSFTYNSNTPGYFEVMLVAKNGSCSDTAYCFYLYPGEQPANRDNLKAYYGLPKINEFSTSFIALKDGGYLIGGYTHHRGYDQWPCGFLMKITESGCIEWSKMLNPVIGSGRVNKVLELEDGNIAVIGYNVHAPYFLQFDKAGNMLWSKTFRIAGLPFFPTVITNTKDKGFVVVGQLSEGPLAVIRINANGDILWDKVYRQGIVSQAFYLPQDVLQTDNDIFITTNFVNIPPGSTPSTSWALLLKIDDATGKTTWTKKYLVDGLDSYIRDIHLYGNRLLINATARIGTSTQNNSYTILEKDGSVVSSNTIFTPDAYAISHSTAVPLPNGDIYFLNTGTKPLALQPGYSYQSNSILVDASGRLKWVRNYSSWNGRYFFPALGQKNSLVSIGDEWGSVWSANGPMSDNILFGRLDTLGGSDHFSCNLATYNNVKVNPSTARSSEFVWTSEDPASSLLKDTSLDVSTVYSQVRYTCPKEFVDSCNFARLTGTADACNLSDTYVYKLHRNKACNQPVVWEIPPGVIIASKTDSEIRVRFTNAGTYKIAAFLPYACSPIKDSIFVSVGSRTPPLNLGKDTSLCTGNTIAVKAGRHFMNYTWQDGSTDSSYTIKAPGLYWLKVSDSCGNVLSDTITVTGGASVPLSIGPDRIKCNNDTLELHAPAGFLQYSWSNNYNISSTTSRSVIVRPVVDTTYFLKAEKSPGCFGYDTVSIKVKRSPAIRLGADTSLCENNQLILDAGTGFNAFLWSSGATTQKISVSTRGLFHVIATTAEGCKSYDSLQVLSVFSKPVVQLNKDSALCTGASRVLDAGANHTRYTWSNGSTSRTMIVNSTGSYSVLVQDANGCQGSDSVSIVQIHQLPDNFLPADTSVCFYGDITLNPIGSYGAYLWSTGETGRSVTIKKPGRYTLSVTDKNNCRGEDTMLISQKQCLQGFYVPNAFSPDGNGKNDAFKPLIYGTVKQYRFTIYNRFGGKIFETSDLQKGWNGNTSNFSLPNNAFVWTCFFQLEGQSAELRKGTVILVR